MKKIQINIPQDTVRRLSLYLRRLKKLEKKDIKIVASPDITKYLNISPEQCRKDLSYFGGFGKRGVGYNVEYLIEEIEKILGTNEEQKVALIGVGKLGSALLGYPGFSEFNLKIVAAFDNDIYKIGKVWEGIKIEDIAKMQKIIKEKNIKIAVLSSSADASIELSSELIKAGIKAILNFTPINLIVPKNIFVSNVDMASELASLVYKLKE